MDVLVSASRPLTLTLSPDGGEGIACRLVSFVVVIARVPMCSRKPRGESAREDGDGDLGKRKAHKNSVKF